MSHGADVLVRAPVIKMKTITSCFPTDHYKKCE